MVKSLNPYLLELNLLDLYFLSPPPCPVQFFVIRRGVDSLYAPHNSNQPAIDLHTLEMGAILSSQLLGHSQHAADLVQHFHNTVTISFSYWFCYRISRHRIYHH